MTATPSKADSSLLDSFRQAFRPFSPMEEIRFWITEAGKDLADESLPEHERYNSAIRLLCSIPAIDNHLSEAARNQIYGRAGVMQPADDSKQDPAAPTSAPSQSGQRRTKHADS
jgi:hypothetical protein